MELIGIVAIAVVVVALIAQLNRNHRRAAASASDPRTSDHLDRDLDRIRGDLRALPDDLASRSLWRIRPSALTGTDDWARQA